MSTLNAITSGAGGVALSGDTSGNVQIQSAGANSAVFNSFGIGLGNTAPTSGLGIAFPATQSASSDANTLDDYEEGTWTPVLGGNGGTSGQTYSFQNGKYTKIGNRVICHVIVKITTVGTITGSLQIQGLPFTSDSTANYQASIYCGYFEAMNANQIVINGFVNTNATNANLYKSSTAGLTSVAMAGSDLAALSVLAFGFTYAIS